MRYFILIFLLTCSIAAYASTQKITLQYPLSIFFADPQVLSLVKDIQEKDPNRPTLSFESAAAHDDGTICIVLNNQRGDTIRPYGELTGKVASKSLGRGGVLIRVSDVHFQKVDDELPVNWDLCKK